MFHPNYVINSLVVGALGALGAGLGAIMQFGFGIG